MWWTAEKASPYLDLAFTNFFNAVRGLNGEFFVGYPEEGDLMVNRKNKGIIVGRLAELLIANLLSPYSLSSAYVTF